MWAYPFDHLAAVTAAKGKAAELRPRERMLALAKLIDVANRAEMTQKQQHLQIRQRGLEQFIEDPYPSHSLFYIRFERDRRAILEAGMPLKSFGPV